MRPFPAMEQPFPPEDGRLPRIRSCPMAASGVSWGTAGASVVAAASGWTAARTCHGRCPSLRGSAAGCRRGRYRPRKSRARAHGRMEGDFRDSGTRGIPASGSAHGRSVPARDSGLVRQASGTEGSDRAGPVLATWERWKDSLWVAREDLVKSCQDRHKVPRVAGRDAHWAMRRPSPAGVGVRWNLPGADPLRDGPFREHGHQPGAKALGLRASPATAASILCRMPLRDQRLKRL